MTIEDSSITYDLSQTNPLSHIVGNTILADLTGEPVVTSKTLKTCMYNTTSHAALEIEDVMLEVDGWGLNENATYNLMSMMPEGATLVNPARKEIIHEPSLLKMFAERKDFRYITDMAPDCSEQLKNEYGNRYYATPKKMAAQTAEANINAGLAAARQIVNYLTKGDKTFQVN